MQPIIENDDDEEEEVRAKEQVNLESKLDRVDVWLDNVECIQPRGVDFPDTAECVQPDGLYPDQLNKQDTLPVVKILVDASQQTEDPLPEIVNPPLVTGEKKKVKRKKEKNSSPSSPSPPSLP